MTNKRLLILGGIPHMIDVVKKAKEMGLYTIVCDYSPTSPAKSFADKAYDVSTIDINLLEDIARKEKVDGVFAGFEDLNTWNALKLCKRIGKKFYASEEQLEITSNKYLFKQKCREVGVPVVPEYSLNSIEDIEKLSPSDFPLIVKPVDSYGSRGITVVRNIEALECAYKKAKEVSRTGGLIVEKFFEGYGLEFYYTVINGTPFLSAITDRYIINQGDGVPPLPTATVFPSSKFQMAYANYDEKIKKFIKSMKIENGLLLFQSVKDGDDIYIYEMAYRLTGEKHYQIIQKETGDDLLEFMIKLSLNEDLSTWKLNLFDENCLPKPACNLAILLKKGKIEKITGLDSILNNKCIIDYVQTLYEGDEIGYIGNYGQIFIRLNMIADNSAEMINLLKQIESSVHVYSDKGEDLIISHFVSDEKGSSIYI